MAKSLSHYKLKKIKNVLEKLLPRTIQVYNLVALELSGDGIEREIIVNDDISENRIAILANNKLESPKNVFTMFCTDNCKDILKGFLEKSIDWSVKTEFTVRKLIISSTTRRSILDSDGLMKNAKSAIRQTANGLLTDC